MNKILKGILSLLVLMFELSCNPGSEISGGSLLLIANVNVIPLDRDTIMSSMDVVIENGRITDISRHTSESKIASRNGDVIDGEGKYLIPALIDCHVHYGADATLFHLYDSLYSKYGVVKVLALNGTPELLLHRDSIKKGLISGPDIQCSGPRVNDSTMTASQARKLLQQLQTGGYDFVKIYSDLSKEGFDAISREAPKYDLRIVGHIPQRVTTWGVLHSSQELVAHAEEFLYNPPIDYMMGDIVTPEKPNLGYIPGLADSVFYYRKTVSPTLIAYRSILKSAEDIENYVADVPLGVSHPVAIAWQWSKESSFIPKKFHSRLSISRLRFGYDFQLKLVNAFNKAGVSLVAGTDAPTIPGVMPGYSLHQEMQLLHEAGLSNYEALKAATINPARFLKVDKDFGTIEAGKEASLLLLSGNPIDDISNTLKIEAVFVKGKLASNPINATLPK